MTEKKKKRAVKLAPFDPGIRFSAVAVGILGPVTMATNTRTNHVLVMTDLITMYTTAVPFSSSDSADVAHENMENMVLKFGAPGVLHTVKVVN